MGRVKENNISGAIGPVVFYVVHGKMYARIKPGERKKKPTPAMLKRNTVFGEVTGPSSRMLKLIKRQVLFPVRFDDYNRLRGWMYVLYLANYDKPQWDIATDNNICQLNPLCDLRQLFKPNITVSPNGSKGISVNFAAFNPVNEIRGPLHTKKVTIRIIAESSPPGLAAVSLGTEIYSFDYADAILPAKEFVLETGGNAGDIAIVAIAVEIERAVKDDKPDSKWLPAAVIAMGRIGGLIIKN